MREYGIINLHKDLLFNGAVYETAPAFLPETPLARNKWGKIRHHLF